MAPEECTGRDKRQEIKQTYEPSPKSWLTVVQTFKKQAQLKRATSGFGYPQPVYPNCPTAVHTVKMDSIRYDSHNPRSGCD